MLANGRTQRPSWAGKIALVVCITLALIMQGVVVAQAATGTWTVQNSDTSLPGADYGIDTLAYGQNGHGQGLWVAGQNAGKIDTSPDGVNWTAGTSLIDTQSHYNQYFNSVVYGREWVMVGQGGELLTSTDGTTWTKQASNTAQNLYGVTYGNGTYVAVSQGNVILSSTDGTHWRRNSVPGAFEGVTYGHGLFVAVGDSGIIYTSPDGVNWTSQTSPVSSGTNLYAVTYGNGLFVATGDNGTILTSPDGVHWTAQSSITSNQLYAVTYGAGKFVAVGYNFTNNTIVPNSATILTSRNGINWAPETPGTLPSSTASLNAVAYGGSQFIIGGINIAPASGIIQTQSTDVALSGLGLNKGTLSPGFAPGTTSYQVNEPYTVSSVNVTPTLADSSATMTVDGKPVASGTPVNVAVKPGASNTVTMVVTAQAGNTQTYTLTVTQAAASKNANLSNLTVDHGTLSPKFASNQFTYSDSVPNTVSSVNVTPTLADSSATMTVESSTVSSGSPVPVSSGKQISVPLNVGSNTISVMVTAQNGNTRLYTISVARAPASPGGLAHSNVTQTGWTESWTAVSGATGYNVYINGAKVNSRPVIATSYNVTGETADSSYKVTVTALIIGGESVASTTDFVTTLPTVVPRGPIPPTIITESLPEPALVGQSYSVQIRETGGLMPMRWTVTSGSLPPGLTLSDHGVISGTPTLAGNYVFTVEVTDANAFSSSKQLTVVVNGSGTGGSGPFVTTGTEQVLKTGQVYQLTLQATGGKVPYTWSIKGGVLPGGLTLNPTTGVISGTPSQTGSYQVTVAVSGADGTKAEKSITFDLLGPNQRGVLSIGKVTNILAIVRNEGGTPTTYMPIWYVMQLLKPLGITSTWDGRDWYMTMPVKPDLSNLAVGSGNTDIYLNGTLVKKVNTVDATDPSTNRPTTFMPIWYLMQLLKRVGIQSTWNGTTWTLTK